MKTENVLDGQREPYGTGQTREESFANRSSEAADEKTYALFQPDILAESQYFQHTQRKNPLEPEKRLMLAILRDAVECFQKYLFSKRTKGKVTFQEAEEWIMEKNSSWLYSFESICEFLGLNADYIRNGLIDWKKRALGEKNTAQIYHLSQHRKEPTEADAKPGSHRVLKVVGI